MGTINILYKNTYPWNTFLTFYVAPKFQKKSENVIVLPQITNGSTISKWNVLPGKFFQSVLGSLTLSV